jgi:hypothetical protein
MPQNRDAVMLAAGDGSVSLWKYQYPDQRKVKVSSSCYGDAIRPFKSLSIYTLRHHIVCQLA